MSQKESRRPNSCPKPSSKKAVSIPDQSHRPKTVSQRNARISLTSNENGTFDVTITAKNLRVRTSKNGKMLTLADVEGIVPIEVPIGNVAFRPKLVLKLIRRITKEERFKIERERVKTLLKTPALI